MSSRFYVYAISIAAAFTLSACGTVTGIPSHGGGKRFATEQEMISSSARSAVKDLDLSALTGKKVALFVTVIGDEGSGNLSGGRYTLDALVRSEYINSPTQTTRSAYPVVSTTADTTSGGVTSNTVGTSVLNAPSQTTTETSGNGKNYNMGIKVSGTDARNETLTSNPRDVTYLTTLIQTVFFLRGIDVVSPAQADTDVFVTVDVFGTIRSRTEWHVSNTERLIASTKMEVFGVDRKTRNLVMPPKVSAFEARYEEKYAFWVGPYRVEKTSYRAESLPVDFSDVKRYEPLGVTSPLVIPTDPATKDQTPDAATLRSRNR